VDDTVDLWVFREYIVQCLLVRNVERIVGRLATADELNSVEDLRRGVVEVVDYDDVVVGLEQGQRGEGANVARSTNKRASSAVSCMISIRAGMPRTL
jgi:hypothetical protein